jgi:predicted DNA-binding protein
MSDSNDTEAKGKRNVGGRPSLSKETEVINIIVPKEMMQRVREVTRKRAATIAGYVRQAIEEKLEREQEDAQSKNAA